jgi:hypothetical protein
MPLSLQMQTFIWYNKMADFGEEVRRTKMQTYIPIHR